MNIRQALSLLTMVSGSSAFLVSRMGSSSVIAPPFSLTVLGDTIVSPFDDTSGGTENAREASTTTTKLEGPLDLTWENVEAVLDEMRPFLIQDGGNVAIQEIDGPVVRLQLQVRLLGYYFFHELLFLESLWEMCDNAGPDTHCCRSTTTSFVPRVLAVHVHLPHKQ